MTDTQLRDALEELPHVANVIRYRRNGQRVVQAVELDNGKGILHRYDMPAAAFLAQVKNREP